MKFLSLKEARIAAGLTQKEAASGLRVSIRTISRWENYTTCIDSKSLFLAASLYQIPVTRILLQKEVTA